MSGKNKLEALYSEQTTLNKRLGEIHRERERLERDETVARLSKNVGKCFVGREDSRPHYYYLVVGISKEETRNRVVSVIQFGVGDDAWWEIELQDSIYNMEDQRRISRNQWNEKYFKAMRSIEKAIGSVSKPKGRIS